MTVTLSPDQRIIYAVGTIVLCCQEIECHFKFIVPFIDSNDPSLTSILARHQYLTKKTFGEVAGRFIDRTTGDTESLRLHVKHVVSERNDLIHHFSDVYRELLSAHLYDDVLDALKRQHQRALNLLRMLQEISLGLIEALRDTTFRDTEQYDDLAAVCDKIKRRLQANHSIWPSSLRN